MTPPSASPPASASPAADRLWEAVAAVPDPEMPPLTIADLGILRAVEFTDDGHAEPLAVVTITPTYSGCPAVEYIEGQIVEAVVATGVSTDRVRVDRVLSPAWSTEWITDEGKAKLADSGISPPRAMGTLPDLDDPAGRGTPVRLEPSASPVVDLGPIRCPQCGSANTTEISRFGSTACKALYRCLDCAEPFDHVKEL